MPQIPPSPALLAPTQLLDYQSPTLTALTNQRGWASLPESQRIGAIYDFVTDEIRFGYNASDDLPASVVLADGYGQCNTKATLFMALLRAAGVACRLHGFTIDKRLQKGAVTGVEYLLAPAEILHSWVEVWFDGRWVNLEGFILDRAYLNGVRALFPAARGAFCGYGVGTARIEAPAIDWLGADTCIQKEAIVRDFGVFDAPDDFYAQHGVNLSGIKRWLFQRVIRQRMNRNVERIRSLAGRHRAPGESADSPLQISP